MNLEMQRDGKTMDFNYADQWTNRNGDHFGKMSWGTIDWGQVCSKLPFSMFTGGCFGKYDDSKSGAGKLCMKSFTGLVW